MPAPSCRWLPLAAALLVQPAAALDLAGLRLADDARVAGHAMSLHSAGVARRALVVELYVASLYLPPQAQAADFQPREPRRLAITLLRELPAPALGELASDVPERVGGESGQRLQAWLARALAQLARRRPQLQRGDTLHLDWSPGEGAIVLLNGQRLLEPQADPQLFHALWQLWLGERPLDAALKTALLQTRR